MVKLDHFLSRTRAQQWNFLKNVPFKIKTDLKIRLKEGSPFGVFDKLLLFEDFLFGDAPGSRPCGFG